MPKLSNPGLKATGVSDGCERTFRLLAGNVSEVAGLVRGERFVALSPAVEQVLGAPAAHWLGRKVSEIIPTEDLSAFEDRMNSLQAGGVVKERVRVLDASGGLRWIHLYARPAVDVDGRIVGIAANFRLIDDAELAAFEDAEIARREQRRADERYRRSMAGAAVGMCLIAADGHFLEVNDALCEFFGYDAATLTQKTWQELTVEDHLADDLAKVAEILDGRRDAYRTQKQYIHADGRRIWGDLSVSCVRDKNGAVENFISQIVDITAAVETAERLRSELASAANYMSSIMPRGLEGRVRITSRYLPSREIGGDSFDYTWIDDDHLLVYLIDVSGHGIEPALLSVSLHNMLRSRSFPVDTLLRPDRLLAEMNRHFQMANQNDHYFTIWYGVYEASTRTLNYACAGAPPALAFHDAAGVTALSTGSIPVGMFTDAEFPCHSYAVPPGCRLLVYSDGAYELDLADGRQLSQRAFVELTRRLAQTADWSLDDLTAELRALTPSGLFEDDCSLIQLVID